MKLVGSQTLIYCGDIFGELDTPGCRPLSQRGWRKRKVLREGNQRRESITILTYGLVLNLTSNVIALRIRGKVQRRLSLHKYLGNFDFY